MLPPWSRELGLPDVSTSTITFFLADEPEAFEYRRIIVVALLLHDGLLWDTQPIIRGHDYAVGKVERI